MKNKFDVWPKERVQGFTDAIFAFATTLLVLNLIELHIPAGTESLLPFFKENLAAFVSFVVTFIIIARFWMSHTRLFAIIKEFDTTIVRLNNVLLFFITIFPFVASILGSHIENKDAVIIYAACFAIIGIIEYLIGRHAYKQGLLLVEDLNPNFLKVFTSFSLSTPIIFIISIFVAFYSTFIAEMLWIILLFLKMGFRSYYKNNHGAEIEIEKL